MPVAATPQRVSNKSFTAGSGASFMGQGLRLHNVHQRNVTTMAAKGTFHRLKHVNSSHIVDQWRILCHVCR